MHVFSKHLLETLKCDGSFSTNSVRWDWVVKSFPVSVNELGVSPCLPLAHNQNFPLHLPLWMSQLCWWNQGTQSITEEAEITSGCVYKIVGLFPTYFQWFMNKKYIMNIVSSCDICLDTWVCFFVCFQYVVCDIIRKLASNFGYNFLVSCH